MRISRWTSGRSADVSADPEKIPVLYRSGHYHFAYTPAEREKLGKYLLTGGMIIYNTGLGSKPFYDSGSQELKRIFPEQPLQRLSARSSDFPFVIRRRSGRI